MIIGNFGNFWVENGHIFYKNYNFRSWMIGNINENMDCGTTNAEAYPKKEIDNQIYYRPREMGVIYNTAGDTKVNISVLHSNV